MNELIIKLTSYGVPTLRPGAMRVRYQNAGLTLIRRDFRVEKAVWFRLGQIARAHGVSRCLLFVALLRAFAEKRTEFRQKFTAVLWRLSEIFDFDRCERVARLTIASPDDG